MLLSGTGYAVAVGCMWTLGTARRAFPEVATGVAWRRSRWQPYSPRTRGARTTTSRNSGRSRRCACCSAGSPTEPPPKGRSPRRGAALVGAGFLAGFAYNLDFGIGPPLVAAVLAAVALRTRRALPVLMCGLAVLPCVIAGHAINYAIGGDFLKPLNMHPEYLAWPGSPFGTTMTGVVRTRYFAQFTYTLDLLVGKKGFLTHNPPLFLAVLAGRGSVPWGAQRGCLLASRDRKGEGLPSPLPCGRGSSDRAGTAGTLRCGGVVGWLMYGVLSKNHGGHCVSIRWFVPFLAPGFWLLAKAARGSRPEFRRDFLALSAGWGFVLLAPRARGRSARGGGGTCRSTGGYSAARSWRTGPRAALLRPRAARNLERRATVTPCTGRSQPKAA